MAAVNVDSCSLSADALKLLFRDANIAVMILMTPGVLVFTERTSTTQIRLALFVGILLFFTSLYAQQQPRGSPTEALEELSSSVQNVVTKVAPAIVRIEVVGYRRANDDDDEEESATHLVSKHESIASGIILDSSGYIVTNAHVVEGARRVRVMLDRGAHLRGDRVVPNMADIPFEARIVGTFPKADLAVLKIEATGLPVLPLADSSTIQPGQLVFAVGNPEGLNNSVSMGVVSAVARQRDSDLSPVYIQTDAAINPGSSGGALVDIHGDLIGMTSFILTEGGGSEGLGFALPSGMVYLIYRELKTNGHFQVGDIGLRVQAITSTMASGLRLPKKAGVIVSDVIPGSPAESGGIQVQDILLSLDGNPLEGPAQYATSFYSKRAGDRVELGVLRGSRSFTAAVLVRQGGEDPEEMLEQVDMQKSIVRQLGIVAVTLNDRSRSAASGLRSKSGVLVAGKVANSDARTGLAVWDLIRSVNGTNVETVENVRSLLHDYNPGDAVVLEVERHGRFRYLSFEID